MLTLLRNPVDNPSYKRGLYLTCAMLWLYAATFLFAAFEPWGGKFVSYGKLICLGLAVFISLRAMSERRVLREKRNNYVPMMDNSILPASWQLSAVVSGGILFTLTYMALGVDYIQIAFHVFVVGAAAILGLAYLLAAKRWMDTTFIQD